MLPPHPSPEGLSTPPEGRVLPVGKADPRRRRPLAHHLGSAARMALARLRPARTPVDLAPAVAALRRDGLAVVEGFLAPADCARLRRQLDLVLQRYAGEIYVDRWGADHRLFLRPDLPGALGDLARDPRLTRLAEAALRGPVVQAAMLAARIEARPDNPGSGAGWHRDSFLSQVKTLIYLDDVGPENGPFQYLAGSHRFAAMLADRRRAGLGWRQRRVPDAAVERLLAADPGRLRTLVAPAGTLLLADTTGIHRGMPIRAGVRHALTGYFYPRWQVDAALLAHIRPLLVPT